MKKQPPSTSGNSLAPQISKDDLNRVLEIGRLLMSVPTEGEIKELQDSLPEIIYNPFYAGWVVSERFGIRLGEVRGKWEPGLPTARADQNQDHRMRRHQRSGCFCWG